MSSLEDLKRVIERIKRISRQLQEGVVETSIVLPILSSLGWDTMDHLETRSKYSFTLRTRREVDIALFSRRELGEPVIFFEVKKTSSTLTNKDKGQLLEYCRLKGAQIGILTNGFIWEFYSEANLASTETSARTVKIKIRDTATDEIAKMLRKILERKAVINGTAHRRLKKMTDEKIQEEHQKASLWEIWKELLRDEGKQKQLAGFLRKMAKTELGENIPQRVAEKFVAEELKSCAMPTGAVKPAAAAKRKASPLSSPAKRLIDYLTKHPKSTQKDVEAGLGYSPGGAFYALKRVVEQGYAERDESKRPYTWSATGKVVPEKATKTGTKLATKPAASKSGNGAAKGRGSSKKTSNKKSTSKRSGVKRHR